jgi:hypothetical protein
MLQTLLQSTRLAQHEYINAFGTDAWREAVSSSVNSNHDHLYPPDPNAPDPEDESNDESDYESEDDPALEPEAVDLGTEPPAASQPATAPPQPPPTTRPSPAGTEAALQVARSIFPDRANATQTHPTATTTNPTPTQTAQPNNAPPPTPPPPQPRRQPGAPNREDYAVHFDHTHRLYVDGKPW